MNITIDQAIKSIETHMEVHKIGEYPHVMIGEALNMAIAALRAQQTPAKLDRSRWKGCKMCSSPRLRILEQLGCQYCEYCGCPLTGKAWAELERKIF